MQSVFAAVMAMMLFAGVCSADNFNCVERDPSVPTAWITMHEDCVSTVTTQIQRELNASMSYLAMGAYFSRDDVNRPGFAKFFLESASEEREHGIKLIEYLLMRGELTKSSMSLIKTPVPENTVWATGVDALKDALNLETAVTEAIRKVIKTCEDETSFNHYHFDDFLITEFLDEQYKGQRDLAGKISVLDKMMDAHGVLGEFLFDKKLLDNEV